MRVIKCFFYKSEKHVFYVFFFNFQINVFNIYDLQHDIKPIDLHVA